MEGAETKLGGIMGITEETQVAITNKMIEDTLSTIRWTNEEIARHRKLVARDKKAMKKIEEEAHRKKMDMQMWQSYVVEGEERLKELQEELTVYVPLHIKRLKEFGKCPICSRDLQSTIDWYGALEAELLKDTSEMDDKGE